MTVKQRQIVCYLAPFGRLDNFGPDEVEPTLCTQIVFLFNNLDPETLLIEIPTKTTNGIDSKWSQQHWYKNIT